MHFGTLWHAQQWVAVEVALLNRTIDDRNALRCHGADTIYHRTLQLILEPRHIDDLPDVSCQPDIVDTNILALDTDLSDFGDVSRVTEEEGES